MKKFVNMITIAFVFSFFVLPVFATIEMAGGGRWDYGVNKYDGGTCWSNYYHESCRHGSTAMNGDGDVDQADGIDAGEESYASVSSTSHGNKSRWHRCGMDKKCGYTQD